MCEEGARCRQRGHAFTMPGAPPGAPGNRLELVEEGLLENRGADVDRVERVEGLVNRNDPVLRYPDFHGVVLVDHRAPLVVDGEHRAAAGRRCVEKIA